MLRWDPANDSRATYIRMAEAVETALRARRDAALRARRASHAQPKQSTGAEGLREGEQLAQISSHKMRYVNYTTDQAPIKVILRKKRQAAADAGTPIEPGDTLAAGASKHSLGADLPLRNLPLMTTPHHAQSPQVEVLDPDTPEASLRELKRVEVAAWQGFHEAMRTKRMNASAMQGFLSQVIRVQEAQSKIRAEMKLRVGAKLPVEWDRVKERIVKALERYPEALAAVLEALDEA